MKLLLKRIAKRKLYTIGKLYIDGVYFCDTIEDTDRGLTQNTPLEQIKKIKIPCETAIPSGTYKITLNVVSPRFKDKVWAKPYGGKIPRLLNVPGFDGVLLHPGSDQDSSAGCVIVGRNKIVGKVVESQATFKNLMSKLKGQTNVSITIE